MGTFREADPLAALLMHERTRVLECLTRFADGGGRNALAEARAVLCALDDAERHVLYPAFSLVTLRPETRQLLDDSRDARAEQLAALTSLAQRRAVRLRKLGAVALSDDIHHHARQQDSQLIPVLASQLPRLRYRSIVNAFAARYEGARAQGLVAADRRRRQAPLADARVE